ncbi:MAG: ATP-binding cassette domain-containing protein [Oscillospiraceae bacterium]
MFDGVSFQFDAQWRLGFLGRNGRGKTTLLRLLMGQYEYGGSISGVPPCTYFPHPVQPQATGAGGTLRRLSHG